MGAPAEYLARETDTIGRMFAARVAREGDNPAFHFKKDGSWRPVSWNQFSDFAGAVASYLLIGFDDEKASARAAALQAVLVTPIQVLV